jgi:hypothetical protein
MLAAFDDRSTGAGGSGGMVPNRAAEQLRWYLAGALDARADGLAANRVERDVLDELVTAAADVLRAGEPPDYSSSPDVPDDAVTRLRKASAGRKSRLRRALDAAREVTLSGQLDTSKTEKTP